MSRSNYSEDYGADYPGQLELYRANVRRSIQGKAGRARLRELRDALLRLPEKKLEADIFADGDRAQPRVCALGAWALDKQSGDPAAAKAMVGEPNPDDFDISQWLAPYGWPGLVVRELVYVNDEWYGGRTETPEHRYKRVLEWVEDQIAGRFVG